MTLTHDHFASLVRTQHAAVYRTAARLLPPADAEDVTQQVFTRIWEGKTALGPEPALTLRWLAGRLALNWLRSARHRRRNEEQRAMQTPPHTTPDDAFTADQRTALRDAIDALPHDLRAAVVLRYQEDLTFDAIASALACSLSTAHDRVQRGLDRLRHALARGGFAMLGVRLPELLPRLPEPAAVPPGLEAQLLSLPKTAVAAAATASAWPIAALALLGIGATFAIGGVLGGAFGGARREATAGPDPSAAAAVVASAPSTPPNQTPPDQTPPNQTPHDQTQDQPPVRRPVAPPLPGATAPATQDPPANEPTARIFGRAFDAGDGQPLSEAKVSARSLARGSKGKEFVRTTQSDATGQFALDVPIGALGREAYTVWVQLADYVQVVETHTLAAHAAVEVRAALRRWAKDRIGEWQMELSVVDPQGAPVEDAVVVVHRRQKADAKRSEQPREASGQTDAAGRVTLRGDHHGEKIVRVEAPRRGLAAQNRDLAVSSPGPHALTIALPQGQAIAGVVRAVADGKPVAKFMLRATQEGEDAGWAQTDSEGRFRIGGCGPEPVTLAAQHGEWSPFTAAGLAPGDEHIELLVKRYDDPQPHGLFAAELHGRVVDQATGDPVVVSVWDVDVDSVPPHDGDAHAAMLDEILHPRPAQRALGMGRSLPAASPEFHQTGLPPGRYAIVVRRRGFAPGFAGPFDLGPRQLIRDIEVRLGRGGKVTGTVLDAAGQPVPKASVYLTADPNPLARAKATAAALAGGDRYPGYHYPQCDASGRFLLPHVPAGLTLRCVAADGRAGIAASEAFTTKEGAEQTLTLRLQE